VSVAENVECFTDLYELPARIRRLNSALEARRRRSAPAIAACEV
jgi:hypothetical protein